MRELVPDEPARAALERELPFLPLSYFEESVPSPAGWDRVPCAYLLLSDAYKDAASDAHGRAPGDGLCGTYPGGVLKPASFAALAAANRSSRGRLGI